MSLTSFSNAFDTPGTIKDFSCAQPSKVAEDTILMKHTYMIASSYCNSGNRSDREFVFGGIDNHKAGQRIMVVGAIEFKLIAAVCAWVPEVP